MTIGPFAIDRSSAFIFNWHVIDGVARTGSKFPHIVSDLYGEAVVQVTGDDEELLGSSFIAILGLDLTKPSIIP